MSAIFRDDLKIGDLVQTNSGLRGKIVDINQNANKWPYTVNSTDQGYELFNGPELTKIEPVKPTTGEQIDALKTINIQIRETEQKLESLKTVRKVLEGLSNADS